MQSVPKANIKSGFHEFSLILINALKYPDRTNNNQTTQTATPGVIGRSLLLLLKLSHPAISG